MSKYTTGELAKQCNVSVRTVQFYDTKGLLNPSELTEGGRRLYSHEDLTKLNSICLLKALGLSLNTIKGVLKSDNPNRLLIYLLEEQKRQINDEIDEKRKQLDAVKIIIDHIKQTQSLSVNSFSDIENIMNGKKKLRMTYAIMLFVGTLMTTSEVITIILWVKHGWWWTFVACMIGVIILSILLVKMYYKNVAYICPNCGAKFKPKMKQFFFASHTLKTRKLTCTECGYHGFCVETYSD